jgi:hypothetical protein
MQRLLRPGVTALLSFGLALFTGMIVYQLSGDLGGTCLVSAATYIIA